MKAMVCEMCGGRSFTKREGVYICEYCGTKYTVEEAKKLFGTVKIDKSEEVEKLLLLARRAREEENSENAEKYYGMVLQENPENWEAAFFQVYYHAMQTNIGNICNAACSIGNCIESLSVILDKVDEQERNVALKTIVVACLKISDLFATVSVNHYNEYIAVDGTFKECVNSLVAINLIYAKLEITTKYYCNDKNILLNLQKAYVIYLNEYRKFFNRDYLNENITRLSNEISTVDPTYVQPTVNSGGCYIATAVYGAYDCPEVWTLRRFRDNILASTWYGKVFIYVYYAISPTLVKCFGNTKWFKSMWRNKLDKMVKTLQEKGIESTPYQDKI